MQSVQQRRLSPLLKLSHNRPNQSPQLPADMSTAAHDKGADLQVQWLTSSATDDQIRAVMAMSARVFEDAPNDPNKHTSLAYWRDRLSSPRARIVFATRPAESDNPLGFFFNFPVVRDELGIETLHIWLAGVDAEARGLGIFPMLLEKTRDHARALGYGYLTVRTMPHRFAKMYSILQASGWEVVGWQGVDVDEKVLMKLRI